MLDLVFGPDPLPCDQRTGALTTTAPAGESPESGEHPDLTQPAGGVDVLLQPLLGGDPR
jgi:hypothetical protein